MNIPERIVNNILSGDMRDTHGLDTGTDSIYYQERMRGLL